MENDKALIIILLSAGTGSRMKSQEKKQFLLLKECPIFIWSIKTFLALSKSYDVQYFLAYSSGDLERFQKELDQHLGPSSKMITLVEGGQTRSESVYQGLKKAYPKAGSQHIVLVHDCARPFVQLNDIQNLIHQLSHYQSATLGYQITDTIKSVLPDSFEISEHLNRDLMRGILTPQGFHFPLIWDTYQKYMVNPYSATDDTQLVQNMGYPVKVVEGSKWNIKITTAEDLPIAELLSQWLWKDL